MTNLPSLSLRAALRVGSLLIVAAVGAHAATPPGRIVFYQSSTEGTDHQQHYQIFSVSPNGGGLTQLTREPADCLLPDLSPDGTKIAFYGGVNNTIYVMNSDGANLVPLSGLTQVYRVAWSPDGTKLACAGTNIGVCNADGTGYVQLSSNYYPNGSSHPTWSPDGTKIAVSGYDYTGANYNYGIYVVPIDGSAPIQRITGYDLDLHDPAWSPDGTKIACTGQSSSYGFYTVDPVTVTPTLVYTFPSSSAFSSVSWSPDGTRLCAQASGSSGVGVAIINPDGTGEIDLPTGQAIEPRWSNAGGVSGDTITISGYANVYNADVDQIDPAAAASLDVGTQPVSIDVYDKAGTGSISFPSVTGGVFIDENSSNGGQGANLPDGGAYFAPEYVSALNGISGYALPKTGALIGVYLASDNSQTGQTAPTSLDFTANGLGTDFTALSPALGQVFFIGDGKAADGTVQKFNVPTGAGVLLLGIADGGNASTTPQPAHGYTDNSGSFNATYAFGDSVVVTPGGGGTTSADLVLAITSSANMVSVGRQVTYTLTLTNNDGPDTATGIKGQFVKPDSFTLVSSTNTGPIVTDGNTLSFSAADLAKNTNESFTFTFLANTAGQYTLTGGFTAASADPTTYNRNGSITTTVQDAAVAGTADLGLTVVDSPDPVVVGQRITYTFTLTNNKAGSVTATNIQGYFVKDSKMTLVASASTPGIVANGNVLNFPLADLPAGTTPETFVLVFTADSPGIDTIGAGVQADQSDPHTADNGLLATTAANAGTTAAHAPVIIASAGGVIVAGDGVNYIVATDGTVAVDSITASGLPDGLSVETKTGAIVGATPVDVVLGDYQVTFRATNGAGTSTATRTFTVTAPPTGPSVDLAGALTDTSVALDDSGIYQASGSYTITNLGDAKAKGVEVGVYLSTSPTVLTPVTAGDSTLLPLPLKLAKGAPTLNNPSGYKLKIDVTKLGSAVSPLMLPIKIKQAGKTAATLGVKYKFPVPAALLAAASTKYRYVVVVIDPANKFAETDETNNTVFVDLQSVVAP